ncbi:hypothetical protein VFPPC_15495 [Pochonia chlamydosporia 170]|uniref:Uncharacterized protein n=1 Tax=Pochonia chlamydosporia 170 TaxID=1380566 RepID=A0A179FXA4_METCM|nr:hypothetical protein VFPPC_15495 [Pochonia chlamydosporia 170]OAQ69848.1 hypothetical protein VFPPC_15495 [Pochonia chlamydosporia 170]
MSWRECLQGVIPNPQAHLWLRNLAIITMAPATRVEPIPSTDVRGSGHISMDISICASRSAGTAFLTRNVSLSAK